MIGTRRWNKTENCWKYWEDTLKVESFAGRKFRDFAIFFADRESLYPPNRTFMKIREILLEKTPKMVLK